MVAEEHAHIISFRRVDIEQSHSRVNTESASALNLCTVTLFFLPAVMQVGGPGSAQATSFGYRGQHYGSFTDNGEGS